MAPSSSCDEWAWGGRGLGLAGAAGMVVCRGGRVLDLNRELA